jgi:hypothetical protein
MEISNIGKVIETKVIHNHSLKGRNLQIKEEDAPQQGANSSGMPLQRAGNTGEPMGTEEPPSVKTLQLTKNLHAEISKTTV